MIFPEIPTRIKQRHQHFRLRIQRTKPGRLAERTAYAGQRQVLDRRATAGRSWEHMINMELGFLPLLWQFAVLTRFLCSRSNFSQYGGGDSTAHHFRRSVVPDALSFIRVNRSDKSTKAFASLRSVLDSFSSLSCRSNRACNLDCKARGIRKPAQFFGSSSSIRTRRIIPSKTVHRHGYELPLLHKSSV